MIHLNGPINLSFLPYGENIQSLVNLGKKHRHEIMLHLPMEPLSQTIDPGPNVIKAQMPESRVKELLAANMNQFEGYVGINNHMGSKATVSKKTIKPLLQMIKQEGLIFLDSRTNCDSVCPEVSDQIDFPILSRDVFLDNVAKPKQIKRQLAQLEKIAKQKQFAIGIGHPHQATTTPLREWSRDLHERGFELVPISFIMKQQKNL